MTDREFLKLNTSIQTASNTDTIKENSDGTIPASIELRLPDSLFDTQTGNKKVDSVTMLTTKFRLSLLETPIAQIPLDTSLSQTTKKNISTCKLDVYPYVIDDGGNILPTPVRNQMNIAFPSYKQHETTFIYHVYTTITPEPQYTTLPDIDYSNGNDLFNQFPTSSRFYELMEKNNLIGNHILNMTIPSTHEKLEIDTDSALVKNISTLEQMWADGLENAMCYAGTGTIQRITIDLVDVTLVSQITGSNIPNTNVIVHLDDLNCDVCYWKVGEISTINEDILQCGVKPDVNITEQSVKISYDTVPFDPVVPVYWSNSFIDTYEFSEQQMIDSYRKESLCFPPPKRIYQYGVNTSGDTASLNYNFSIPNPLSAEVFNIVANKATKDTFPFLPWVPIDNSIFQKYTTQQKKYICSTQTETNVTGMKKIYNQCCNQPHIGTVDSLRLYCSKLFMEGNTYHYTAGFDANRQLNEVPQYLLDYLTQTYPVDQPFTTNTAFVIAIDFIFPEQDIGYTTSLQLKDVSPYNRFNQRAVIPMEDDANYADRAAYHSEIPLTRITDVIVSSSDVNDTSIATDTNSVYITTTEQTLKHELESETNTPVDNTTLLSSEDDAQFIIFYKRGDTSKPYTRGIDRYGVGTCITQDFVNHSLTPNAWRLNILRNIHYMTWYQPPFDPDDEVLSNDPIYIDGVKYLRGSLIWNMRPLHGGTDDNYMLFTTNQGYTINTYENLNGTQNIREYSDVSLFSETDTPISTVYPNLMDDTSESLYLLNGASSIIDIGSQEVIQTSKNLFSVTTEITTTTKYRDITETINGCDDSGNKKQYQKRLLGMDDESYPGFKIYGLKYKINNSTEELSDAVLIGSQYEELGTIDIPETIESTIYSDWYDIDTHEDTEVINTDDLKYATYLNSPYSENSIQSNTEYVSVDNIQASGHAFTRFTVYNELLRKFIEVEYTLSPLINSTRYIVPGCEPNVGTRTRFDETYDEIQFLWKLKSDNINGNELYCNPSTIYEAQRHYKEEYQETEKTITVELLPQVYKGNIRLTYTWNNLPTVIMSPIQSFVIVLNGMNVSQEIYPINIAQPTSSSLTSTIPIVENYLSLATSLRDLHDELVVIKETYSDSAFYKLDTSSGQERTLTLTVKYVTKDGRLHQVNIPKNGVYMIQLTFGISYYLS